ncbi:amino acid adenylation domain-containing protein [Actinocrispum sp. NPDC049592]|uniref:non-ribosomal peptide synthetase n=1 Tax=Actinocrispum sp. NPDC049592 TaxID=3154835 RepID=UPI003434BCB1
MPENGLPDLTALSPAEKRELLGRLLAQKSARSNLSLEQRRLWYLRHVDPSVPWHVSLAFRVTGALDRAALQQSLAEVVNRHDVLRSTFVEVDGRPFRALSDAVSLAVPLMDLSDLTDAERATRIAEIATAERGTVLDIATAPLLRVLLVRCAEDDHILVVTGHQLIVDERSTMLVVHELFDCYAEYAAGGTPQRGRDERFVGLVAAQQEWVGGEEYQQQLEYWRRSVVGVPSLDLPTDRPRGATREFQCHTVIRELDSELLADIERLAATAGCDTNDVVLAAYVAVLSRYAGLSDLSVGCGTIALPEHADVVGPLHNTLPLRFSPTRDLSFMGFLEQVHTVVAGGKAHGRLPFEQIVEELKPRRDLTHNPFFEVAFEGEPLAWTRWTGGGLTVLPVHAGNGWTQFDVTLSSRVHTSGLTLEAAYDKDILDESTVAVMLDRIIRAVRTAAADPDRAVGDLVVLDESERRKAVVEFNDTDRPYPADLCLHQLVEQQADRTPDALAVHCGQTELTYRELDGYANAVALRLLDMGGHLESVVAVLAERSAGSLVALLGVLKAGMAYLPIDPSYPRERQQDILADSGATVLIAGPGQPVDALSAEPQRLRVDLAELEPVAERPQPVGRLTPDHLAYVIYTSGSTGRPKGVAVSHRSIVGSTAARWEFEADGLPERYLVFAPLSFDAAGGGVYWTLSRGGTVYMPTETEVHDPRLLRDLVAQHELTHVDGVPAQYSVLLDIQDQLEFPALRMCITAGDVLTPSLVARHFAVNPGASLFNEYGPTEATVWASTHRCGVGDGLGVVVPVGRPVSNCRVFVLDGDLVPVLPGLVGEIFIGGVGVARGYVGRGGLTAERFVPDPFGGGGRLYRTGDRGRHRVDGVVEFLGRVDKQVKVRGFRVELGEIENAILSQPGVIDAAVLLHDGPSGEPVLAGYVVPAKGANAFGTAEIGRALARRLPDYMVPATLMMLDRMPLTEHGKIDRDALPKPTFDNKDHVAPRTALEANVTRMLSDILGVPNMGVTDDFFALGGNSLLVARLVARISREYDIDVPVFEIFKLPSAEGIAGVIENAVAVRSGAVDSEAAYAFDLAELKAEIQLDPDIDPAGLPPAGFRAPRHVLVTGATGYVGAFIVAELIARTDATVHCLVRSSDPESAVERLDERLRHFRIDLGDARERVRVVHGDLAQPRLGLSPERFDELADTVDAIYHSGAVVNFVFPYDALKATNVGGTEELLRLACHRRMKAFHHVSSMDVYLASGAERPFLEVPLADAPPRIPDGYPRSKWIAEGLVAIAGERGLPVSVYRPWMVMSHSSSGASHTTDYLLVSLKGFLELGVLPSFDEVINASPVDYVAAAIVHVSTRPDSLGGIYHVGNLNPATANETYAWVKSFGYQPNVIDFDVARAQALEVEQDHPLYPLTPIMRSAPKEHPALDISVQRSLDPSVECANTLTHLVGSGIECPPMNEELAHSCFAYLVDTGFLPAPTGPRVAEPSGTH